MEFISSTLKTSTSNKYDILTCTLEYPVLTLFQASIHSVDYAFTAANTEPREKDAFGLDTRGRLMLVPADRFAALVDKMSDVYAVSSEA